MGFHPFVTRGVLALGQTTPTRASLSCRPQSLARSGWAFLRDADRDVVCGKAFSQLVSDVRMSAYRHFAWRHCASESIAHQDDRCSRSRCYLLLSNFLFRARVVAAM